MRAMLAAAFAMLIVSPAAAQMMCGAPTDVIEMLAKEYGERLAASGLSTGGALLQIFAADSGTWTLTITQPDGPACVFMVGDDWEPRPVPEKQS